MAHVDTMLRATIDAEKAAPGHSWRAAHDRRANHRGGRRKTGTKRVPKQANL